MSQGHDDEAGSAAPLGVADRLSLAAAPAFAIMTLLTAAYEADAADRLCSAATGAWALGGMTPMYVLMSAAHIPPWVRLIARRRTRLRQRRDRLGTGLA